MDNQRDELQDYIDHLTTLIAKLAPDGTILMVNTAAVDLVGTPAQELLGRKIWETPLWVNSGREQAELQKGVEDAASGKRTHF
jgi:PAS domain S-box-containing protein